MAWNGTLGCGICVILRTCIEALARFHALGGNARLREKSVKGGIVRSEVNHRDIAEAK